MKKKIKHEHNDKDHHTINTATNKYLVYTPELEIYNPKIKMIDFHRW